MNRRRPSVAVVVFPGSNDDRDAADALADLGAELSLVWHGEPELPTVDAVVLPGGFSYGDYLRCGAIARFAPVMPSVIEFARGGGLVLGICNGYQILCEAELLSGALRPNTSLAFVCRDVGLTVERADTPFTSRCVPGQRLTIPVKHGDGCWHPGGGSRAEEVVLRYAHGENPNGSAGDAAGVVNGAGNVMGLMPHPEHAVNSLLGSTDGRLILGSMLDAAHNRSLAVA